MMKNIILNIKIQRWLRVKMIISRSLFKYVINNVTINYSREIQSKFELLMKTFKFVQNSFSDIFKRFITFILNNSDAQNVHMWTGLFVFFFVLLLYTQTLILESCIFSLDYNPLSDVEYVCMKKTSKVTRWKQFSFVKYVQCTFH